MGFHNEAVDLEPAPEDILSVWGKDVNEQTLDEFFGHGKSIEPGICAAGGLRSSKFYLEQGSFLTGASGKFGVCSGLSDAREKESSQPEKGSPAGKISSPSKVFCQSGGLEDIINCNARQGFWNTSGSLHGQDSAAGERSSPLAVFRPLFTKDLIAGDPAKKGFESEAGNLSYLGYGVPNPVSEGSKAKGSLPSGEEGSPPVAPGFLLEKNDIPSAGEVPGRQKELDAPDAGREEALDRERIRGKIKKAKTLKARRLPGNLLLGMDVQVEDALKVAESTLVGRFRGRPVLGKYLQHWAEEHWKETPARSFKTVTMAKGWFMISFDNKSAMEWVEERNWPMGKRPVFFKRWSPLFDASKETVEEFPVWVRVRGLPPFLWVDSVFSSIGNSLGTFFEADKSFLDTHERVVARILVRLNPRELVDSINLQYRDFVFEQLLDYELLPFRCHRCHKLGHLARDCPLGKRKRRVHKLAEHRERSMREEPIDAAKDNSESKPMDGVHG